MPEHELTEREREILRSVPDKWVRPMDIGGRNGSDHSQVLRALAAKGAIERRRRGTLANALGSSRGSYVYRNQAYIAPPLREPRFDSLLKFTRILAGYGCAGVGQEPDDPNPCGQCSPCEASAFLRKIGDRNGSK